MRVKGGVIAFLVVGMAASVAPAAEGVDALDVGAAFVPTGQMGDAEAGTDHVQIATGHATDPHSDPSCIQVSYTPGTQGWAGVYWQNRSGNWGEHPGEDLKRAGYKRLTFWARGESGGEVVEFKAGGIDAPRTEHKDSFVATTGGITLGKEWNQYTLDLASQDLTSVIGGFCWIASANSNPDGLTFYVDDIQYER